MPQGDGGSASREHQRSQQMVLSSAEPELASSRNLFTPLPENSRGRTLTYEDLSRCFHLPINAAAKDLGVCVTALKKQCRKHGVQRWPHRKLKSLDKLKEKLEKEEATAADKEYYKHEIHSIAQKKDHIFRSSTTKAQSSRNAPPNNPSASQVAGNMSSSSVHSKPQQLVLQQRPFSHVHHSNPNQKQSSQMTQHYPPTQGSTQTVIPGFPVSVEGDHPQVTSVLVPISHIPPNHGSVPGQSNFMPPQGAAPAPFYTLCGIFGCDCVFHNGVSSRMLHPPIQQTRPAHAVNRVGSSGSGNASQRGGNTGVGVSSVPPGPGVAPAVQFFSPASYPYSSVPPPPYQNMVQVNMMEQPPFVQGQGSSAQPSSSQMQTSSSGTGARPTQSLVHHPSGPVGTAPGFDIYSNVQHSVTPSPGGFVYTPLIPPGMPYEGFVPPSQGMGPPGYWQEGPQAPGNLVAMCNQTVHHHHHHSNEASPVLAQGNSARAPTSGGSPSRNNSEAHVGRGSDKNSVKERGLAVGERKPCPSDRDPNALGRQKSSSTAEKGEKSRAAVGRNAIDSLPTTKRKSHTNLKDLRHEQTKTHGIRGDNRLYSPKNDGGEKSFSSQMDRDTRPVTERSGKENELDDDGIEDESSDTESLEIRGANISKSPLNKRPRAQGIQSKKQRSDQLSWRKSSSSQLKKAVEQSAALRHGNGDVEPSSSGREITPEDQVDGTGSGSGDGNDDEDDVDSDYGKQGKKLKKPSRVIGGRGFELRREPSHPPSSGTGMGGHCVPHSDGACNGDSPRSRDGGYNSSGDQPSTASVLKRASRYDHMVHQCLELQAAQWCTNMDLQVTLALGPKALLALAGVPSLGRSVLEGTETSLESKASTHAKYTRSSRGQRQEWIATNGKSQYLIVMSPFRKRNSPEISGVSGLMVELKYIQGLSTS